VPRNDALKENLPMTVFVSAHLKWLCDLLALTRH